MKDYNVQIYGTWGLEPKVWAEAGVGGGMSLCSQEDPPSAAVLHWDRQTGRDTVGRGL